MGNGTLRLDIKTANGNLPVTDATATILSQAGNALYNQAADESGLTDVVNLEAPDKRNTLNPNYTGDYYSQYNVRVEAPGFQPQEIIGVQIYDGEPSVLPVIMEPLTATNRNAQAQRIVIGPNALLDATPRIQEHGPPSTRVLREVIIPEYITVHLGPPKSQVNNVRVPFIDYCKNVASSEIFPTWPVASLEANILCQISLALNRVYTEWYPNQGYNFNITSSTTVDQYFVYGRNIYDSVAVIVDRIFNHYLKRAGFKEPFYAEYCDGIKANCPGLKQWGTVTLADRGYTPMEIIHYYYPKDIEQVVCNRIEGIEESYPGTALRMGSYGTDVQMIQLFLNRIRTNFPQIPRIANPNGVFGADTQAAVIAYQKIFNLTPDGVVGRATWNSIHRTYTAVKKLAELTSEGERVGIGKTPPTTTTRPGDRGENVVQLQFLLNFIAQFDSRIPSVLETGEYDNQTREAVLAFQRSRGLTADGLVGAGTWRALYDAYYGITGNVPTPPAGIEDYPGSALRVGSSGDSVRLIQTYLNQLSQVFDSIPAVQVDGVFGAGTELAVRQFQRLFGLTVDGVVGPSTWNAIIEQHRLLNTDTFPGVTLRVGSKGDHVLQMQRYLNAIRKRYPTIPALTEDGVYGNGTAAAVREFQRIFGLTQDGVIGPNTWNTIVREYKNAGNPYSASLYPGTPLSVGASGEHVSTMQSYLSSLSQYYDIIPNIPVDGKFGDDTANAVRAFQRLFGMTEDGVIGPQTWQAINDAYWNITNRDAYINALTSR